MSASSQVFAGRDPSKARSLCGSFITAKGFDQNYTVPDILYTQWFVDTYAALKKLRNSTSTTSKLTTRILTEVPPLQLGNTFNFDSSRRLSSRLVC